jgi:hypothetical protein
MRSAPKRLNHQYSERDALPLKSAYLRKQVTTASRKVMGIPRS